MYRGRERGLKRRASPRTPRQAQALTPHYPKERTTIARQGPAQFEPDDEPNPADPLEIPDPPEDGWYPENEYPPRDTD